jgi:hypothetical protein
LTLREEHGVRVFENSVLRIIFGPKRDEVTAWRELHDELRNLHSSPGIIRMIKSRRTRWAEHVAQLRRNACRILVGMPEGKRPQGRPKHRWVGNIEMDLREIGWVGMDWVDLAQDRDQWRATVNTAMKPRVP